MTGISKLTIATIILNLFILIPYGGFLVMIEFFSFYTMVSDRTFLPIYLLGIFSLSGQLLLMISIFLKNVKTKFTLIIIGLLLMWLVFYYMAFNGFHIGFLKNTKLDTTIFLTGLPFLMLSIILLIRLFKKLPFKTYSSI